MQKRFILFIDFSEYSKNLLNYASDWSQKIDAELLLVHRSSALMPSFVDQRSRQVILQNENAEAMRQLKELANSIVPHNIKVSYFVSEDHLPTVLPKLLKEPYDHLLLFGLKGTTILKKIFIGSTTIEIIESSDQITVALPDHISSFSHEKIFVAVSKKHTLNPHSLNRFLRFLDAGATEITFFYLAKLNEKTDGIEKELSTLAETFSNTYKTNFTVYEGDNAFDDIKKVINNKIEEILIVQKGSRLLTDKLFRKFMINELVYEGKTPLVVLP